MELVRLLECRFVCNHLFDHLVHLVLKIYKNLESLLEHYQIIHLSGRGKMRSEVSYPGYWQTEYVSTGLADLLALSSSVISRAGANSIFELRALQKPMVLVPLVLGSRGDQVVNAQMFAHNAWAEVLEEKSLSLKKFISSIEKSLTLKAKESSTSKQQEDSCLLVLNMLSTLVSSKVKYE